MWNFTRSRQTAGNICLVLFTAFLLTILVTPYAMVQNAEAAALPTVTTMNGPTTTPAANGQTFAINETSAGYHLLVNLAAQPLSAFQNLRIDFVNANGTILSVYGNNATNATYQTYSAVYGWVYSLVYDAPSSFYVSANNKVYGKVYAGSTYLYSVILTLNPLPPITPPSTGPVNITGSAGSGSATLSNSTAPVNFGSGALDLSTQLTSVSGTSVTLGGVTKNLTNYAITGQNQNADLTRAVNIGGQSFNVGAAVGLQSGVSGQPIVITGSSAGGSTASIPDGTTVLAPTGWNGQILPPALIPPASVTGTAPTGYLLDTSKVIKFGSTQTTLLFDHPVTLIIPNSNAGVAYKVPNGPWTPIINMATGGYANPTPPAFPQEAYVTDGTNTKVITWHATEFAPITASASTPSTPSSSSGGGGAVTPIIVMPTPGTNYSFDDIANHWAKDDIQLLINKGIVNGISANKFAPDAPITRAQFATLLVKALGLSQVKPAKATFKDVKSGAWYYGMVETAAAKGLVAGFNGKFNPEGKITRQEMAVMIAKALKIGGKNVAANTSVLSKFSDKKQIASWAQSSIAVAVKEGIISGRTASTVVAKANATRAEGTVMIKKVLSSLGKL